MASDFLMTVVNYLYPFWTGAWGSIRLALPLVVLLLVAELVRPGQRLHWPTLLLNGLYIPIYLTLAVALLHPISAGVYPWLSKNVFNIHFPTKTSWVSILYFLLYYSVFDFFYYWFHRAQHHFKILWRYHLVHHTDVNISMSSSTRHHWVEEVLRYFLLTAPLVVVFGGAANVPAWMMITTGLLGLVIHWNMPWRMGFLGKWTVTPWYHRIHHSIEPQHMNKNFAVFLPFWDWLFGTRHVPTAHEFPHTGVAGIRHPNSLGLIMPWPVENFDFLKKTPDDIKI